MSFTCKDVCYKMAVKDQTESNYSDNKKYCSVCSRFFNIFIPRCPCCFSPFRITKKNKNRVKQDGIIY